MQSRPGVASRPSRPSCAPPSCACPSASRSGRPERTSHYTTLQHTLAHHQAPRDCTYETSMREHISWTATHAVIRSRVSWEENKWYQHAGRRTSGISGSVQSSVFAQVPETIIRQKMGEPECKLPETTTHRDGSPIHGFLELSGGRPQSTIEGRAARHE